MGLSAIQRDDVRNFLISRGLAFKPLLDEMSDHVGCDIEEKMNSGMSYDEAWKATIKELPEDHFKIIQQETMETINRRFNLSRIFTYVALVAMIVTTIFKMLHLRGAEEALLLSVGALGISLITGSISGIYYNRDKKGSLRVVAIVLGIILMIVGYAFKILHLPGGNEIILVDVFILITAMLANTIYVYRNASGNGNLFTFLHEKYSPGIERFLMILTAIVVCFGEVKLFTDGRRDFVSVLHVVAIYGAGFQLISLTWRSLEQDLSKKNITNLVLIIASFVCLCLPMLADIVNYQLRMVSVMIFSVVAAILAIRMDPSRNASSYIAMMVAAAFVALGLARLGVAPILMPPVPVSFFTTVAMVIGIIVAGKNNITRMYLILSLAGYFLEVQIIN